MRLGFKLLLVLGFLLMSICITEVGLRLVGIRPIVERLTTYKFHSTLGWVPRNSFAYRRNTSYYDHWNFYDSDGLPTTADGLYRKLDADKISLALIGDSFAEGYYLPYEDSIAGILGKLLTDKQIINLGVSGYAPDQYYLRARDTLRSFKVSHAAILFFPYNDIDGVHRAIYGKSQKPLFTEPYGEPVNTPLYDTRKTNPPGKILTIFRRTAIYTVVSHFREYLYKPDYYNKSDMAFSMSFMKRLNDEYPHTSFTVYYIPRIEEQKSAVNKENVKIFLEICADYQLNCVPIVFQGPEQLDLHYIQGDGHFSKFGSEKVAKLIADTIYIDGD
jgi:hypothetical protein